MTSRNMFASTQKPEMGFTAPAAQQQQYPPLMHSNKNLANKKNKNANKKSAEEAEEIFSNLSRIASTHAATRIRDATMRLLSIWFANVSQKMLGALDVPAKHLERFQDNPNEDSLTNFMDSFIAAKEVIKEQLADDEDGDDENNNNQSPSSSSPLGPRGNPFEINNRLFDLFVQTIDDAIGSMKVAMDEEDDDDDDEEENEALNTNNGGGAAADRADSTAAAEQESGYFGSRPPLSTVAPPSSASAHQQSQQQHAFSYQHHQSNGPTPNREWRHMPHDDTPPPATTMMNANSFNEQQQPIYNNNAAAPPPTMDFDRFSVAESNATTNYSTATSLQQQQQQQNGGVSSVLLARRQKKFGVAGKVGLGADDVDANVLLPTARGGNNSRANSVAATPRANSSAIHSSASGHNDIFNPHPMSSAAAASSSSSAGRVSGRAHPQHLNPTAHTTGTFLHYNDNDGGRNNVGTANHNNNANATPRTTNAPFNNNAAVGGGINQQQLHPSSYVSRQQSGAPPSATNTSSGNIFGGGGAPETPRGGRRSASSIGGGSGGNGAGNSSAQMRNALFGGGGDDNYNRPASRAQSSAGTPRSHPSSAAAETAKQAQLRHEITVLEAQITAARNTHGTNSDAASAKIYAINKKINVVKAELLKETREVEAVLSIQRERDAQRAALDEKRRVFHR